MEDGNSTCLVSGKEVVALELGLEELLWFGQMSKSIRGLPGKYISIWRGM